MEFLFIDGPADGMRIDTGGSGDFLVPTPLYAERSLVSPSHLPRTCEHSQVDLYMKVKLRGNNAEFHVYIPDGRSQENRDWIVRQLIDRYPTRGKSDEQ